MLLSIEPDGETPIYQQIRDRIVEAIAAGHAPAGSPLPSTRQLATDLGVNFHTVNKSYDMLRQAGLVRINRKSGAVVQRDAGGEPPHPSYVADWTTRLRTLLAEAAAHGMPRAQIIQHCDAATGTFAFPASPTDAPEQKGNTP